MKSLAEASARQEGNRHKNGLLINDTAVQVSH